MRCDSSKRMKTNKLNPTHLALALTLIALQPAFAAEPAVGAAREEAAAAESYAAERKAALAAVDAQIDLIEAALDSAPDAAEQTAAKARLAVLKERRSALRKDYAKAKFEELQADTKVEYQKVAAWTKATARDVKEKVVGPEVDAAATARAAANPEANSALADITLYRLNPSPENKEEVKAALKALDAEIDRLEDYADTLPKGDARKTLEKRIKALEKREGALKRDFTKARWDALVGDVKNEWHQVVD